MGVRGRRDELGRGVRPGADRPEAGALRHGPATPRPVGPDHDERRALGHGHRLGRPVRRAGRQDVRAPVDPCARARPGGVARRLRGPPVGRGVQADLGVRRADARRGPVRPPRVRRRDERRVRRPHPGDDHDRCSRSLSDAGRQQDLVGQTVVVIGGSSGIGLETARLARAHGADVVLTARDPDRLHDAAEQVGARGTAAFDVTDLARLERFFEDLPGPIDHVMVDGPRPVLLVAGRHGLRRGAARHRRAPRGAARRRPLRRAPDAAARHPALHRRHRRPPRRRRSRRSSRR